MKRLLLVFGIIVGAIAYAQNVTNYTFTPVPGTYNQIFGTGLPTYPALSGGNTDDGYYNNLPIGFTFYYENIPYTTISASTNGWAMLGGPLTASVFNNNIATGTQRPILAPLWDDLEQPAGLFCYLTAGTAPNRVFTIEWPGIEWNYSSTSTIGFQIKLYESTRRIEFHYRQNAATPVSPSASIGIGGVTSGQFLSLNNASASPSASSAFETTTINTKPANGQIYRFDHYPWIPVVTSVAPVSGNISTLITISGSGFSSTPAQNIVYCGAVKANVISSTPTQIVATVMPGTDIEKISVTTTPTNLTGEAQKTFDVTFPCGGVLNTASFSPYVGFAGGSGCRTAGTLDVDLDGKPEVVVSSGSSARVYRNVSTPGTLNASSLAAGFNYTLSAASFDMRFADLDGDGKKEIITANNDDSITVLRNTSTPGTINAGTFAAKVNFRVGPSASVDAGDIDGDGKPELVACSRTNNQVELRQNNTSVGVINGASFGAAVLFTTGLQPYDIRIADFDGDNKNDVVVCNYGDSTVSVFRNTSVPGTINATSFAPRVDYVIPDRGMDLNIADMDGDGKLDIICMNQPYTFSVLRNTGSPGTLSFVVVNRSSGPLYNLCSAVGDIDGDSKPDVAIGVGSISNAVVCLRNTSTPGVISFSPIVYHYTASDPFGVGVGDVDGDGRPEIIAAHLAAQSVSILPNVTNSLNAIAPATVMNATTMCDNGTWKTYHNPADNTKVLFAVKDNGNNLGTITVDEYRDAAPGNYLGNRYLQRHFKITPAAQPSTPVQVRLFFTNAEITALQAVDPSVTGITSLSVTKYNGPTEDATYNPLDATSLTWYPPGVITSGTMYGGLYLEFTISSFSEFWIHGGSGVLPIELTSFDASPENSAVHLTWTTASETNNDFFVIERSQDGISIESIDTIDGAGTSSEQINYLTIDEQPYSGLSYYRLKQVDFNGHFSCSEWKPVSMTESSMVSVFPNPNAGTFHILLPGEYDANWTVRIADISGKQVYERVGPKWDMDEHKTGLKAGTYIVTIISETNIFSEKMIITGQ